MRKVCYDTSVFISYKPSKLPAGFVMSAVVIQEMTAGAATRADERGWDLMRRQYEARKALLVPTGEEWWQAGHVLGALLRGEKSKAGGKTPKLHPNEKQRIVRDALIAVTVKRAGALLVTTNVKDFEQIHRYCKLRFVSARDYFGYDPGEE